MDLGGDKLPGSRENLSFVCDLNCPSNVVTPDEVLLILVELLKHYAVFYGNLLGNVV